MAGSSILNMMLNSMSEMFKMGWKMDFITDISGTDYLLKKPEEFKKYLSQHIGMNFVSHVRGTIQYKNKDNSKYNINS